MRCLARGYFRFCIWAGLGLPIGLFPYPNVMGTWPQFRSPLVWDVFAVSTYATVSLLFWFVGLIPDLATLRDRSKSRFKQVVYGIFAMGWRGSAVHWHRYEVASILLAGLATPLVVSVHTVVSFDFAAASCLVGIPRFFRLTSWPARFIPGFAMVMTLAIPIRKYYPPGRFHHYAAFGKYGQGDAGYRVDRGLRVHDGDVYGIL